MLLAQSVQFRNKRDWDFVCYFFRCCQFTEQGSISREPLRWKRSESSVDQRNKIPPGPPGTHHVLRARSSPFPLGGPPTSANPSPFPPDSERKRIWKLCPSMSNSGRIGALKKKDSKSHSKDVPALAMRPVSAQRPRQTRPQRPRGAPPPDPSAFRRDLTK